MATVATRIAASRSLFFIGAWQRISSAPKGMLVGDACQWRGCEWKSLLTSYPPEGCRCISPKTRKETQLIHTQRDERINACRAMSGKVAGQEAAAHQEKRDGGVRERVGGADTVQQA